MLRTFLCGCAAVIIMTSCSTTSKLSNTSFNNTNNVPLAKGEHGPNSNVEKSTEELTLRSFTSKSDTRLAKMINAISPKQDVAIKAQRVELAARVVSESLSELQIKFGALLNIIPSTLSNVSLLENLDEWMGTRYRFGGTTKSGIDCSAFTRTIMKSVFNLELPRTAREQYGECDRISATELKEGDLVFFNTRGGVSHVGIYLRNNKFIHASSSKGVTISDMFDPYYMARFIGGGRILTHQAGNLFAKN